MSTDDAGDMTSDDAGDVTTDDGGTVTPDAGGTTTSFTMSTVQNAVTVGPGDLPNVELDNVVVVAAYSYTTSGAVVGTFYVQDQSPSSSTGLAVYVGSKDSVTFPAVGDIVTVQGHFSTFGGALQVSSNTAAMAPLSVTKVGTGGMSSSGAYSPAGAPTMVASTADYAHTASGAHPEQVGNVLQFAGPLSVTSMAPAGFVSTSSTGTAKPAGFEVTGGLWVNDSNVFYNCLKGKGPDGGTLTPDLSGGIRGVWDRFADRGSDAGTVYPVLIPMSCDDLIGGNGGSDGGTMMVDAGQPGTDAGTTTTDAGTPGADAGTPPDAGTPMPGANTVESVLNMYPTPGVVEVDNAVVAAAYSYTNSTGNVIGSFYLQDTAPMSGRGLLVYVSSTDAVKFPSIGDVVKVTGYLSTYNGAPQVASDTTSGTMLTVTSVGSGGMCSSGAYAPAGMPVMVSSTTGYDAMTANAHPELLGAAVQFAGPLQITSQAPTGLVHTKSTGGTVNEGFEITGGVYVYDANIYYDCMKGKGPTGGTLYPDLSKGIRGIWYRYQDGTNGKVYPVLVPMSCADLSP